MEKTTSSDDNYFNEELSNKHFQYTYDNGWKYEFWVKSKSLIVYKIHGGPMAGRSNYQTLYVQRIRKNLWQLSWLEETGTIVSLVLDIEEKRITTFMAFSKGHWTKPEEAHGDKRNQQDLQRWRGLATIGNQMERHIIPEQANIDLIFEGRGDLDDVDENAVTL
ncbi:padC [Acrasis kona]|uniref:PadC n=1 Tax=Acrasis kona TaxID=1008807 RepID=A0AAW2ZD54_9EUKA